MRYPEFTLGFGMGIGTFIAQILATGLPVFLTTPTSHMPQ
jgi:hypothetical protein